MKRRPHNSVKSKSKARWHHLLLLALMLPLVVGTRRGEPGSGSCGRSGLPREFLLVRGGSTASVSPSVNRTQDLPLDPSVPVIQYRGDESSILYAWQDRLSGEALLGRRYFGISQYMGQVSSHGSQRYQLDATTAGLPGGIPLIRHYDRGNCSVFQTWETFRDQLKAALDRAVEEGGARRLGNSTLTPLLALDLGGRTYLGDTDDTFRFTRKYSANVGPLGFFLTARIEGGFRTTPTGAVQFVPTSITVRNNDGQSDAATTQLESELNRNFANQLNAALDNAVFQRLPAGAVAATTCEPTAASVNQRCQLLLSGLISPRSSVPILSPDQVRCHRRTGDTARGFCEFRPNVLRTQEYPEGFEFVLSENPSDQGAVLISLDRDTFDRLCFDARAPVDTNGITSGIVRRFDAP